jgi:hypothetical protein
MRRPEITVVLEETKRLETPLDLEEMRRQEILRVLVEVKQQEILQDLEEVKQQEVRGDLVEAKQLEIVEVVKFPKPEKRHALLQGVAKAVDVAIQRLKERQLVSHLPLKEVR